MKSLFPQKSWDKGKYLLQWKKKMNGWYSTFSYSFRKERKKKFCWKLNISSSRLSFYHQPIIKTTKYIPFCSYYQSSSLCKTRMRLKNAWCEKVNLTIVSLNFQYTYVILFRHKWKLLYYIKKELGYFRIHKVEALRSTACTEENLYIGWPV